MRVASIHERRIVARLAGVEGVPGLRSTNEGDPEDISLEDGDGEPLAQVLNDGPLKVPALLEMALHLANTLAAVHRRGVVHQNITPDHILLRGPRRPPLLVDFHLATTFAEERPAFTHHREIRGNLVYLAPEQTGRTGRSVDLRSDLYALGATLYESATGRPPFEAQDPLQLLHDHLARLPTPPVQLRSDLPEGLSQIILRLLEKEPERRYQSAEGLAHDLAQVQRAIAQGDTTPQRLGEHDFPLHFSAPARLVGRNSEIAALRQALDGALLGRQHVVLVSGAPGVGKTSLINELRPMVTARRGWFVSGKFDQFDQDVRTAPEQAFAALGRLLLAEPEADLAAQRERILRALGANAGLMCTGPDLTLLLGPQPDVPPVDPAQAEARFIATAITLLRTIVSPERPVVMVLDDLQWAAVRSIHFIDAVLDAPELSGLLLVGSYRDGEVDAAHPLAELISQRSRQGQPMVQLGLANLPAEDVGELLREMMRLPPAQASALAQAVGEHTGGNPYDTVELLNALRRDGALRRGTGGWEWDAAELRRFVGQSGVLDLLTARIERLPPNSQAVLHALACLGGEVPIGMLRAATALSDEKLNDALTALFEDGLMVVEPGENTTLRMRHDRVQQAVYATLQPAQRRTVHLALARRLATKPQLPELPEFRIAAAQQYLPAVEGINEPAECASVARLLREAAVLARSKANYAAAERLVAAALSLLSRPGMPTARDESLRSALEIDHHIALCSLGRLEAADAVFRLIESRNAPVEDWVDAACAQVGSLNGRTRVREAVMLGLSLLQRLGLEVPEDFGAANIEQRLAHLTQWIEHVESGHDPRPYTGDRRSLAAARLINRLEYAAYFQDLRVIAWLILESQALWTRHGPSPELAHALAHLGAVAGLCPDYYRTAYDTVRHVLGVSEARGWESGTSEARYLFANQCGHWFEPLEQVVHQLHLACEGMMRNGEMQGACYVYRPSTNAMLDCSPTLQGWAQEVGAGVALAFRVRLDYVIALMSIESQLLLGLRGQADAADDVTQQARASLERQSKLPTVSLSIHYCHALLAAVFGDLPALTRHAAAAMEHVSVMTSYRGALARVLQAFSLAQRVRKAEPGERQAALAELDAQLQWLTRRASDSRDNFLHLLKWIEAERAWAVDDFRTANAAFDVALCQVETLTRPWHHAMLTERAGLFHVEQGMSKTGQQFIAQARDLYRAWGADAKVHQMERTHGFLESTAAMRSEHAIVQGATAVDTIDALAILRASQALSSETSLAHLKTRVTEVMGALTGATAVRFALWDDDQKDWFLFDGDGAAAKRVAAEDAGARGLMPLSAFRYAERTREPLLVEDATADDRFARDSYFAGLSHCSLLIVPILNQGILRAMLLLENRLSRGAFSTGRLDAVSLIAGQLAVSLENALLYDRLEQRVRDQTRELLAAARRAGMAQIATNVLHNVGNVLNSVNVSAHILRTQVRESRAARVADLAGLVETNAPDLARFFAADGKGRLLPAYLRELAQALQREREELLAELERLGTSVDHIKNVVAMQQSYAGASGVLESCSITELVDDALRIHQDALASDGVSVNRDYAPVGATPLDKTRVMQIMVNLIENARHAMDGVAGERKLGVAVRQEAAWLRVAVTDAGCGISADNLSRIFSHGFTTKAGGHGFGLHSCAMAAKEMGGTLAIHSAGLGTGATFTLRLPLGNQP